MFLLSIIRALHLFLEEGEWTSCHGAPHKLSYSSPRNKEMWSPFQVYRRGQLTTSCNKTVSRGRHVLYSSSSSCWRCGLEATLELHRWVGGAYSGPPWVQSEWDWSAEELSPLGKSPGFLFDESAAFQQWLLCCVQVHALYRSGLVVCPKWSDNQFTRWLHYLLHFFHLRNRDNKLKFRMLWKWLYYMCI